MTTTTVLSTTAAERDPATCTQPWCRGHQEPGDTAPEYDCWEQLRHEGRVWHYDRSGFAMTVSMVAYIGDTPGHQGAEVGPAGVLLSLENTEIEDDTFCQGLSLEALDGLISTLTAARSAFTGSARLWGLDTDY